MRNEDKSLRESSETHGPSTKTAAVVLLVAGCLGPWGCALKHPRQATYDVRAQSNTIALPAARFLPDTELEMPGKGRGAATGAGYGAAAGAVPGLAITGGVAKGCSVVGQGRGNPVALVCVGLVLTGLGVAAAGGAVGALGGAAYGAVTAEPASALSAAEREIRGAVVTLQVQEALRDRVLQIVASDRSPVKLIALDDAGPTAINEPIGYGALTAEGIDTVVEVSVPKIGLVGKGSIHPPLRLLMTARARVIRTADGAELYAETFEYHGDDQYKFVEWGAEEGKVFRQALDEGIYGLASDIARALFPPGAEAPAVQSTEAATIGDWRDPAGASTPSVEEPADSAAPANPDAAT